MLVAKESAAELRTRGRPSPSCSSETPALYVASDVVIALSTSACKSYFFVQEPLFPFRDCLVTFAVMLSHCSLGKQHEVCMFGKALLLSGSRRHCFYPPTPSAPHPQPVNLSGGDLKTVHLAIWSQQKQFRSLG